MLEPLARPTFAAFKADLIAKEPVYKSVGAADIRAKYVQDFPPVSRDHVVQTRPFSTPVSVMGMMGAGQAMNGSALLEVSSTGIAVKSQNGRAVSAKWGDLRELVDALATQGRFRVNFGLAGGPGSKHVVLWISPPMETAIMLTGIFKSLPPETRALRCGTCSGPVENDVCKDCGESFRAGNRRSGLLKIAAGAALAAAGLLLTLVSHSSGTGSANVAFVGLMGAGGALVVMGLASLVSGARL
jgi:hypothetical protein